MKNDLILLLREPAVSHAYISQDTLANGHYRLNYHIEENKTLIPAVDLWQSVNNPFAYHLGLTDYNLSGRGIRWAVFFGKITSPALG